MVARTVELPNIRKMFIPDEGYSILNLDLERADAAVVAWEAGDEELKQMFREGADIHTENAITIFGCARGDVEIGGSNSPRQMAKKGVHAVNYHVTARTLAIHLGITILRAQKFIDTWLGAHPGIGQWHDRTEMELRASRTTTNAFGFRRYWFDRVDNLLSDALAWVPQSTVGIVTYIGWANINENYPQCHVLNQVHDSLVLQVPTAELRTLTPKLIKELEVPVPYEDPLTIAVEAKVSDVSWGDCKKPEWLYGEKAA